MDVESPEHLERLRGRPEFKVALLREHLALPASEARFERAVKNSLYWPPVEATLRALALLVLWAGPSVVAQTHAYPTWLDNPTTMTRPLPVAYEALGWDRYATQFTRSCRIGGGALPHYRVNGSSESGVLSVQGWSATTGSFAQPISTPLDRVYCMRVHDFSTVNSSFGNESLLISGQMADGTPQVCVLVRNVEDDPRASQIHLLPVTGNIGEVFCRVGSWAGHIVVFEAESRSLFAFSDSNSDGIPDSRLAPLITFPSNKVPYIPAISEPPSGAASNVIAVTNATANSDGEGWGLYLDGAATVRYGRVLIIPNVTAQALPENTWAQPPVAGMMRMSLVGTQGSNLAVERRSAGQGAWTLWLPTTTIGFNRVELVSGGAPLVGGEEIRLVVSGIPSGVPAIVDAQPKVVVWDWSQADTAQHIPFEIVGENLDRVTDVSVSYLPFDYQIGVREGQLIGLAFSYSSDGRLEVSGVPPTLVNGVVTVALRDGAGVALAVGPTVRVP